MDAPERQIELLGRDLGERRHDALAELDLAGEHGRGAVRIDADPGVEHAVGLQAARQLRRHIRNNLVLRSDDKAHQLRLRHEVAGRRGARSSQPARPGEDAHRNRSDGYC